MIPFTSKKNYKALYISDLTKKINYLFFLIVFIIFSFLFLDSFAFSQSQAQSQAILTDSVEQNLSTSLDSSLVENTIEKRRRASFSVGFRGGVTISRFEIANPASIDKNEFNVGSVFTVFTNYSINSRFSIQPELALGRYRSNNTLYRIALSEGIVDYTISTLDFNLIGIYSYPLKDWFSISAEAGLSAAYQYNSFGKVVAPNAVIENITYDVNSDDQFEKLNYGAILGLNPSFTFENVTIQTSIRYRHGLNNINSFDYRFNRYLTDSERTIKTRDILFQIGFLIPIYRSRVISD